MFLLRESEDKDDAACGRCHGMLGLGGEGPNLARPTLPRAPDHASVVFVFGLP